MAISESDRLAQRGRPDGSPVLHQRWRNLLFLHWPMDPALVRPLVPDALELDTFDGVAWVGITPFHLEDIRPPLLPALPGLSAFNELNVRSYVTYRGVPGIWFFSLDASKLLPAMAARIFFMLPYFKSSIRFSDGPGLFEFSCRRSGPPDAEFRASWTKGPTLRDPDVHSLAFFLTERYSCFAVQGQIVYKIRIYHHPWILHQASPEILASTMIGSLGLPEPVTAPLAHFSTSLDVEIWAPEPVNAARARSRIGPKRAFR
ncbi:MAG TPA: DUF2071 domain-containing protein [Verrucomicrobiae bacterium]|nr:DUF2071 domain-containing protein [Verrucomicrobiae bacterium]